MRFHLIIPSSGTGIRFGSRIPKQYLKIGNNEIIAHTISRFIGIKNIRTIYIPARPERFEYIINMLESNGFDRKKIFLTKGGETRQHSVHNALKIIESNKEDFVIVHDAVRPYVTSDLIKRCMEEAVKYRCVVPCVNSADTVKIPKKNLYVRKTLPRESVFLAQTPQIFRLDILKKSYNYAAVKGFLGTDDSSVVEYAGFKVKIIEGEKSNIKITSRADILNNLI
jgi:2-C-methyl-D-erythritol 4-phosphate cytidylyltransferase